MELGPPTGRDAVLFDLDGTLLFLPVDVEAVRDELRAYFRQLGVELEFRPLLPRLDQALAAVRGLRGAAQARAAARWARHIVSRAEVRATSNQVARPGSVRALQGLLERDVPVGVVSNNTRAGVDAALSAVGVDLRRLASLVSREDVPSPKPAPDGIHLALQELAARGWPAPRASRPSLFFVGDAPADAAAVAAARSGATPPEVRLVSVGVRGGRVTLDPAAAHGFDHLVEDDLCLEAWLLKEGPGAPA